MEKLMGGIVAEAIAIANMMNANGTKCLWLPQAIICVLLLWALFPNPYGYYILLRWIVCPCFIFTAAQLFTHGSKKWAWAAVAIALMFNPLIPIHLPKELWRLLDVVGIGFAVWSVFLLKIKIPMRLWVPLIVFYFGFGWVFAITGLPFDRAILYFAGTETRGRLTVINEGSKIDEYGEEHSGYVVEYSFEAGGKTISNERSYSGHPGYWSRPTIIYWKLAPAIINIPIGPESRPTFFMSVILGSIFDIVLYGLLAFAVWVAYSVAKDWKKPSAETA
ncbi:DUF6804 family protein [Tichowtungia aerotolerans]|uniref:Uncharacterized protein n=1 Tax=Tichowtungia aerotolerans TaxID=2697043 RepID=A0A6P1M198_9BACT|nr:DUF6804 family protein [Tichowtungia aerotolerans]QHI68589.1 hypothetical protein GT409_03700 [Tichowtungia aerotolerans]